MPTTTKTESSPSFREKLSRSIETMEKTEMDHVWESMKQMRDDVARLESRLSQLEQAATALPTSEHVSVAK